MGPKELIHLGGVINNTVFYCFNTPGQIAIANSLDQIHHKDYSVRTDANGTKVDQSFVEDTQFFFESTRDYITEALNEMALPMKPLKAQGGYFIMADISECEPLIPDVYKDSHDYEDSDTKDPVNKYRLDMPDGRVPLDLAFCRWMAVEHGVAMMPNSFFYAVNSPTTSDKFVRLAICKDRVSTEKCVQRMKDIKV